MPKNNDSLVRMEEIQKSYDGETLVIKNMNMDVTHGEFLTMLGPSGSGKTTCLMMVAGFEPATHGEIYLNDRPINKVPPHKRGIGMVFQDYALFPHMTVAENLEFPLKVRKMSKEECKQRIKRVLDMVQLRGFEGRRSSQLSGGQQQRIAVARSMVFDPDLILMDEPLGALDKNLREQMQLEIRHLHERLGVTVIYVTHDQSEALTMSDRIAVFDDGVIQQLAHPDKLYEEPENAFVAHFIGENNRLLGNILEADDKNCKIELDSKDIIQAKNVNIAGIGNRTTLSLRPERVVIEPAPGSMPNIFNARVEELIYLGDHIRTRLKVCGHDDFVVKVANSSARAALNKGETVKIGWNIEDCRALDPSG